MSSVIAVVEGPTEQSFVREVLAPWLWNFSRVELVASAAGTPGKKGGNNYSKARTDIINHLKNPHFSAVTTFFDFYGMPPKWPGRAEAVTKSHADKPRTVEGAIRNDISEVVGEELASRLYPYVQMYEFEALLFSETSALPGVMRQDGSKHLLDAILNEFNSTVFGQFAAELVFSKTLATANLLGANVSNWNPMDDPKPAACLGKEGSSPKCRERGPIPGH